MIVLKIIEFIKRIGIIKLILVILVVYLIIDYNFFYDKKTIINPNKNIGIKQANILIERNELQLFDPSFSCKNFKFNGYNTFSWKGRAKWWSCQSDLQYKNLDGSINRITFYAESSNGNEKIETIKIQADIFDTSFRAKVKKEYQNRIKEFMKKSSINVPKGLFEHIESEEKLMVDFNKGTITFEVDNTYMEGYGLVLVIKPIKNS